MPHEKQQTSGVASSASLAFLITRFTRGGGRQIGEEEPCSPARVAGARGDWDLDFWLLIHAQSPGWAQSWKVWARTRLARCEAMPATRRACGRRAQRRIRVGGEQRFDPCVTRHRPWVSAGFCVSMLGEAGAGRRTLRPPGKAVGTGQPRSARGAEGKGGIPPRAPGTDRQWYPRNKEQQSGLRVYKSRARAAASRSRAEGGAPHGARLGLRTAQVGRAPALRIARGYSWSPGGSPAGPRSEVQSRG